MRTIRVALTAAVLLSLLSGCASQSGAPVDISASCPRTQYFNDGWKFTLDDVDDADRQKFDDSDWRDVDLPHDWSIEGPFDESLGSATAYLPGGIGWYRKSFDVAPELKGKRVAIRFDGIYENSKVWCNGTLLGERPSGYASFEYDMTPYLQPGKTNVIAVSVDRTNYADSRWYTGSGIYRNVFLTITDPVHVAYCGTFVTTLQINKTDAALGIETTVSNDGKDPAQVTVTNILRDPSGAEASRVEVSDRVSAAGQRTFNQVAGVHHPVLWSTDEPAMYDMETIVTRGQTVLDRYHTPFGIRTAEFNPKRGFLLNSASVKLKGVCIHQDAGALGAAIPLHVWERRLTTLKSSGCNAIRMSHNPPAPELLDLCDKMGFLVMDEAFDEWTQGKKKWTNGHNKGKFVLDGYHTSFDEWAQADLHDIVQRDRNHPSIILWSIGNEIDYPNDPYPPNTPELSLIATKLIQTVKQVDTSRPVTAACAAIKSNLYADQLDVVGYNYQEDRYAADHAAYPRRVIYGSENKPGAKTWQAVRDNAFISGQFLWTGIDYLGESPGWPSHASFTGLLDLAGFKKPLFYLEQSLWSEKPMVFLNPIGRSVLCFSNCETVEVFQDGESLGAQKVLDDRSNTWTVPSPQGDLKAVGRIGGKDVCEYLLKSAGDAAKLTITCDNAHLAADGRDVAQIEVSVADSAGTKVRAAANLIQCSITGPAKLIGIESGDPASLEDYKADHHKAFRGRMMVYIQSTGEAGEVTFSVSSDGLTGNSVHLDCH